MLIVSALIRIFLGGPVVVAHERIGFAGTIFTCYGFRTMVVDADEQPASAGCCASRAWTSCRNCSTCCAAK